MAFSQSLTLEIIRCEAVSVKEYVGGQRDVLRMPVLEHGQTMLWRNCCVCLGREVVSEALEKHSALRRKLILNQNSVTVYFGDTGLTALETSLCSLFLFSPP